jgi:sulfate adenylyltransferase
LAPADPRPDAPPTLYAQGERRDQLLAAARDWPSWDLAPRQLCDLELLLDGSFAPLTGFLGSAEVAAVARDLRLPDGRLWAMPIVLDVTAEVAEAAVRAGHLALRDAEGVMLAVLQVTEAFALDGNALGAAVCGTEDPAHPGVALHRGLRPVGLAGPLVGTARPSHYDFPGLRKDPAAVHAALAARGTSRVVAFQTRNPLHRAHHELTLRAMRELDAALLLHPAVGATKPGDLDHYTRVRGYQALLPHYPHGRVELALLPLAMRMAGPREALWHAAIRRNYGATHFIVGRDHAGPGADASGRPFYDPYAAQELVGRHQAELGITMVPFQEMVFVPAEASLADPMARTERAGDGGGREHPAGSGHAPADAGWPVAATPPAGVFLPRDEVPAGAPVLELSGSELRRRLRAGEDLPNWFTFPEVAAELRRAHPPRHQMGLVVFFTGLSGAGKSTIANVLLGKLLERGERPVTLLDGDLVRKHLSSELGFSRAHRDLNIRRIGFVASEIAKNGGIALCAPIAPYAATRNEVRAAVSERGGFVLVHVATPLAVCEARDRKGLYAKARAGLLPEFTGISDPYEVPTDAEVTIDASVGTPLAAADQVLRYLAAEGYLTADPAAGA